jgi:hypothetical protein
MPDNAARAAETSPQATVQREVTNVSRVDGQYTDRFRVWDSESWETKAEYEKIFATAEEFASYLDDFFDLAS